MNTGTGGKRGYIEHIILRGCWMLESDWLSNVLRCAIIFRETHGERSSRHRITCTYHFAKWFTLFQRSLQPKTAKEPKPTTTLAKQINIVNKWYKRQIISMILPQNYVLLCTESTYSLSPALSPSQTFCTHVNISANVVRTTLTIWSVTV